MSSILTHIFDMNTERLHSIKLEPGISKRTNSFFDDDGQSLFEQQIAEEKARSRERRKNADHDNYIQVKLLERHDRKSINSFLATHSSVIKKSHYLYLIPPCIPRIQSATFKFNWSSTENKIYTLDSYSYCLFSRSQYKDAIENGISKGISLSLSLSVYLLLTH